MPYYTYTCEECGKSVEKFFSMASQPVSVKCECGKSAKRDLVADLGGYRHSPSVHEPHFVESIGVHPEQVGEMQQFFTEKGFKPHECEFNKDGDMKVLNRSHQKRVLKARGMVNLDGGYGD